MDRTALIVIGGGGHACVVLEAARSCSDVFDVLGFVDPGECRETAERLGVRRLGDDGALRLYPNALGVIGIGTIGSTVKRVDLAGRLADVLHGWAMVVHRGAWVSPTATLGEGTVVFAGAVINSGARVGRHCVVNTGTVVEHDVVIEDHVFLGPGAVVGGGAWIGSGAFIGLGATVRDHKRIGERALVGMGAVVVGDVKATTTVVGVPARAETES